MVTQCRNKRFFCFIQVSGTFWQFGFSLLTPILARNYKFHWISLQNTIRFHVSGAVSISRILLSITWANTCPSRRRLLNVYYTYKTIYNITYIIRIQMWRYKSILPIQCLLNKMHGFQLQPQVLLFCHEVLFLEFIMLTLTLVIGVHEHGQLSNSNWV